MNKYIESKVSRSVSRLVSKWYHVFGVFSIVVSLLIGGMGVAYAKSCWSVKDKADSLFAEMDAELSGGKLQFLVRDSVNCKPIVGAKMRFKGFANQQWRSNAKGVIYIAKDELKEMPKNDYAELLITAKGYIEYPLVMPFDFGVPRYQRFALSKRLLPQQLRVVLHWGKMPRDLDLHVKSDDFHISYRNMKSIPNKGKLDRDDTSGFGPETITLDRVLSSKEYEIFVHNYSGSPSFNNQGRVEIYLDNRMVAMIPLKKQQSTTFLVGKIKQGRFIRQ